MFKKSFFICIIFLSSVSGVVSAQNKSDLRLGFSFQIAPGHSERIAELSTSYEYRFLKEPAYLHFSAHYFRSFNEQGNYNVFVDENYDGKGILNCILDTRNKKKYFYKLTAGFKIGTYFYVLPAFSLNFFELKESSAVSSFDLTGGIEVPASSHIRPSFFINMQAFEKDFYFNTHSAETISGFGMRILYIF